MKNRYAVFTSNRSGAEVVICPVARLPELTTEPMAEGPLVISSPLVRFARDLEETTGPVTVSFRDAPTDDDRYGDAPWVAPEVARPIRSVVRDAVAAVFNVMVPKHTTPALIAA